MTQTQTRHFTAAGILRYVKHTHQTDLVYEAMDGFPDDQRAELHERVNAAHRLGYWQSTDEGLVVITAMGQALIDAEAAVA